MFRLKCCINNLVPILFCCRFKVTYTVVLGENSLHTSLHVDNKGFVLLPVVFVHIFCHCQSVSMSIMIFNVAQTVMESMKLLLLCTFI